MLARGRCYSVDMRQTVSHGPHGPREATGGAARARRDARRAASLSHRRARRGRGALPPIVERDPGRGAARDRLARIAEQRGQLDRRRGALPARDRDARGSRRGAQQPRGAAAAARRARRGAGALSTRDRARNAARVCCTATRLRAAQPGALAGERRRVRARAGARRHARARAQQPRRDAGAAEARSPAAVAHGRRAVALQPDWDLAHSNLLFCLAYADDLDAEEIAAQHRAFGRRRAASRPAEPTSATSEDPDRPLRVGLVSPDFKQHSVAYFIEPLLEAARDRDGWNHLLRRRAPSGRGHRCACAPPPIAGVRPAASTTPPSPARADRIDILIDLAGHTAGNRMSLFAARVAPVQMTYLGYPEHHRPRHRRLAHHRRVGRSARHDRVAAQRGAAAHHRRLPLLPPPPRQPQRQRRLRCRRPRRGP